jgi:hypothetical protein
MFELEEVAMRDDDEIIRIDGRGGVEALAEIAAGTNREAILKAGQAWKRDEATLDHMMDLHTAVLRRRGPYAIAFEREVNAFLATGEREGINEHLAHKRDELRALLRRDIEAVIAEARGGLAGGRA